MAADSTGLRYGMTPPPEPGGNPGQYEERLAQWFLEVSFFRDFVFRNPKGKTEKDELADAVVLYGDVLVIVQVKANIHSGADPSWPGAAIRRSLGQLQGSYRMLAEEHVTHLDSDAYGVVPIDMARYPHRIGLIVLADEREPYDPEDFVPELAESPLRVHIFSLKDFVEVTSRFDTPGDLVVYLDLRDDLPRDLPLRVHDESSTLLTVAEQIPAILTRRTSNTTSEMFSRSAKVLRDMCTGVYLEDPDYIHGQRFDDVIARLHDVDDRFADFTSADPLMRMRIAEEFSWLTRARRIALGRELFRLMTDAADGGDHFHHHYQRRRKTAHVFYVTSRPRPERMERLKTLTLTTHVVYDAERVIGVATNPIHWGGWDQDVVMREGLVPPDLRAEAVARGLPFEPGSEQLLP